MQNLYEYNFKFLCNEFARSLFKFTFRICSKSFSHHGLVYFGTMPDILALHMPVQPLNSSEGLHCGAMSCYPSPGPDASCRDVQWLCAVNIQ